MPVKNNKRARNISLDQNVDPQRKKQAGQSVLSMLCKIPTSPVKGMVPQSRAQSALATMTQAPSSPRKVANFFENDGSEDSIALQQFKSPREEVPKSHGSPPSPPLITTPAQRSKGSPKEKVPASSPQAFAFGDIVVMFDESVGHYRRGTIAGVGRNGLYAVRLDAGGAVHTRVPTSHLKLVGKPRLSNERKEAASEAPSNDFAKEAKHVQQNSDEDGTVGALVAPEDSDSDSDSSRSSSSTSKGSMDSSSVSGSDFSDNEADDNIPVFQDQFQLCEGEPSAGKGGDTSGGSVKRKNTTVEPCTARGSEAQDAGNDECGDDASSSCCDCSDSDSDDGSDRSSSDTCVNLCNASDCKNEENSVVNGVSTGLCSLPASGVEAFTNMRLKPPRSMESQRKSVPVPQIPRLRDAKQRVVGELLCRWWYVLPEWPPENFPYDKELEAIGFRRVQSPDFECAPEFDEKGLAKAYELIPFKGVFRNSRREIVDVRPEEGKPSYSNLMQKPIAELYRLLITAYENQLKLVEKESPDSLQLQEELRSAMSDAKNRSSFHRYFQASNLERHTL